MKEPMVVLTVEMTPEDYVELKKKAAWGGFTVAEYIVAHAMGRIGRGC